MAVNVPIRSRSSRPRRYMEEVKILPITTKTGAVAIATRVSFQFTEHRYVKTSKVSSGEWMRTERLLPRNVRTHRRSLVSLDMTSPERTFSISANEAFVRCRTASSRKWATPTSAYLPEA
jgi:hypothetical protein